MVCDIVEPETNPAGNKYHMVTRSKAGISKPKVLVSVLSRPQEPRSTEEALSSPEWIAAMNEEMDALTRNKTWSLVPSPGCKCVFKVK